MRGNGFDAGAGVCEGSVGDGEAPPHAAAAMTSATAGERPSILNP
jgi:hypothetical protein